MINKKTIRNYLLLLLVIGFSGSLYGQTIYEAEEATFTSGLTIETSIAGYSGSGYVGNFSNDNDKLSFKFSLTNAGSYNMILGVAAPNGDKTNIITINGNKTEFSVTQTSSFQEKQIGKVRLTAGENTIEITKSWGWFYVDYLKIEPNTDPTIDFNISSELVTPNASDNTKTLYQFLIDHFEKKIISGVMTLNSFDESDWLKQQTGKEPALLGLDFMQCNRGYTWYNDLTPTDDAKTWYNKNGIPAMCWHWRDPSRETEAFYTEETSFDVSKIMDENSAEYQAMISDIDYLAGLLKELTTEDIPILWRPLHEASGGWFWWGAKGPEACKKLWQIMFDRLVNHHEINNLIWVWTTDTGADNMDWYPGDEYVDILGVDIYTDQEDFSSQYLTFDKIKTDFEGKKMVTLSECGIIPDPDKLIEDEAGWSYFMPWYGDFVRNENYNPLSYWEKLFNHDYVITLDEMPDLRDYTTSSSSYQINNNENFLLTIDHSQQILQINPQHYQGEYNIEVCNLTGSCYYKKNMLRGIHEISLSNLPKGLILVAVKTRNSRHSFKLFI